MQSLLSIERKRPDSLRMNMNQENDQLPAKRPNTEFDVLDLSKKPPICENDKSTPCNTTNKAQKGDDDVILLSEDEDERLIDQLCCEMEKENDPKKNVLAESKALLRKIENELRSEENTLLLLQQLRANQRSHSLQVKSAKPAINGQIPVRTNQLPVNQVRTVNGQFVGRTTVPNSSLRTPATHPTVQTTPSTPSPVPSTPKVTKSMAIQILEQQCAAKKVVLRKQLERSLDKVALPRPATGTGLSEVAFVPSTLTNEFTSLIGLEEVVRAIQEFDPNRSGKSEQRRVFSPFACVRCGTDFTPVWKRERPGSSDVVCEACISDGQRSRLQKEYEASIKSATKHYTTSERDVEREYQDVINTPSKLDAFIKEHEKKLAVTHQAQLAAQQQQLQQQTQQQNVTVAGSGAHNHRYHQQVFQQQQQSQQQPNYVNAAGLRHSQSAGVLTSNHLGTSTSNRRPAQLTPSASTTSVSLSSIQQQQQQHHHQQSVQPHAAVAAAQQLASQYQHLNKVINTPANVTQNTHNAATNNAAAASLMMAAAAANPMLAAAAAAAAAAANNQQQQQQQAAAAAVVAQQQQQQRLAAAAAALSGLQQQQQQQTTPTAATNTVDQFAQFAQMQAFIMNSLLCGAAAGGNQANSTGRQQQQLLQQALLQYTYLIQQQQQQQAAVAAQAQQQQQQQQLNAAALQQFMGGASANSAACMALLQNLWALNAAGGVQQHGKK